MIYQINTRLWIQKLSIKYHKNITFANIPQIEFAYLKKLGFDYIWLMGVWKPSKFSENVARNSKFMLQNIRNLDDKLTISDIISSPYAVADYSVNPKLGTNQQLSDLHQDLNSIGLKLILDFVPNHTALDHYWIKDHPEYFFPYHGNDQTIGSHGVLYGKDPNYAPWTDTAQLNYFNFNTRVAMQETILDISNYCDAIRCDMAMLVCNNIFSKTWSDYISDIPNSEFWSDTITYIKKYKPNFQFIAEVYWDMESELINQGFDFCYDKRLYNQFETDTPNAIVGYLRTNNQFQSHLVRFLENHDEKRAVTNFTAQKSLALFLLILSIPGNKLVYDGQIEGFTKKIPVQLGKYIYEEVNNQIFSVYQRLLSIYRTQAFSKLKFEIIDNQPIKDAQSSIISILLSDQFRQILIVINLSDQEKSAMISYSDSDSKQLIFNDIYNNQSYIYSTSQINQHGLYVKLLGFNFHILDIKKK